MFSLSIGNYHKEIWSFYYKPVLHSTSKSIRNMDFDKKMKLRFALKAASLGIWSIAAPLSAGATPLSKVGIDATVYATSKVLDKAGDSQIRDGVIEIGTTSAVTTVKILHPIVNKQFYDRKVMVVGHQETEEK